ncbi:MAG: DUF2752 domain-containing protein [Cyclobacteriaceae bacterium]
MAKRIFYIRKTLKYLPFEAICWFGALALLGFSDTTAHHFSLCPLKNAGFAFCPGCGLGRSVTLLFHGDIAASFEMHPLGIFAVIVLSFRIVDLTRQYLQYYGKSY